MSIIERIERALVLLAYFIELDGDVHLPMYEQFERELAKLKNNEDTRARAKRRLLAYSNGNEFGSVDPHQAGDTPPLIWTDHVDTKSKARLIESRR